MLASAKARGLQPVTTEKDLARMQGEPSLNELAAAARTLPVQLEFADPTRCGLCWSARSRRRANNQRRLGSGWKRRRTASGVA